MAIDPALIPPLMTVPVLVGLQIALAPRYTVAKLCGTPASARLCRALKLPWGVTEVTIQLSAGSLPVLTVTKLLTEAEANAIADWYETEGIDSVPCSTTVYNLEPKRGM